jgi:G3E family GTPase
MSPADERTALRRLDGINPAAPRWEVSQGEIEATKLLDLGLFSSDGKTPEVTRWLSEEAYAAPHGHAQEGP